MFCFVASICDMQSKRDALYKQRIGGTASSGLIQQTTDWIRFLFFFLFFITKKTGFDISCSGDNLHEVQIMFSWKNEKDISNCRLLKIVPRVLSVKVCTNNSRMSLCMAKPTIKLVQRDDQPAHSETAHQQISVVWSEPSLIVSTPYDHWV